MVTSIPSVSSSVSKQTLTKLNLKPPSSPTPSKTTETENLAQTFGGYTVKQRLREEVESPFRKVRFLFFLASTGSAFIAFYFSALSALKATMVMNGSVTYADAMPMEEALTNCGINLTGVLVCSYLAYRDYQAGQSNLERIAKGGQLARLAIEMPEGKKKEEEESSNFSSSGISGSRSSRIKTLSEYRRTSRILICAGGKEYIENVCRTLNADQLNDTNNIPGYLEEADLIVVPVLLNESSSSSSFLSPAVSSSIAVGDTKTSWRATEPLETDRNFDSTRSDNVIGFPRDNAAWKEYLKSDIETASKQGFNVIDKGFTITIKKNGKVLRRATGVPNWGDLIGAMEVLDGSKFGMPGDSERYGGP